MVTTDGQSEAQAALTRLVADKARPHGITIWCDTHRPDLEIAVKVLGVPVVGEALAMPLSSLYSYLERREIERREMRVEKPTMAITLGRPAETVAVSEWKSLAPATSELKPERKGIPYLLWSLAVERRWSARRVAALASCRLKAVHERSVEDWEVLSRLYDTTPSLLVDSSGRPLPEKSCE